MYLATFPFLACLLPSFIHAPAATCHVVRRVSFYYDPDADADAEFELFDEQALSYGPGGA